MNFTVFNADGKVIRIGTCPPDMFDIQALEGESVLEGIADPAIHYVVNNEIVPRPASPARLDGMQLFDVPHLAQIQINNQTYKADSSIVELEFTYPGTYKIKVMAWPYLDADFQVNV